MTFSPTCGFEENILVYIKLKMLWKNDGRKWKCSDFENIFCWVGLMGFRMSEVTLPPPPPPLPHIPKPLHIKKIVPKGFAFLLTERRKDKIKETKETAVRQEERETWDRRDRKKWRRKAKKEQRKSSAQKRRQVTQKKRNNSKRKQGGKDRFKETRHAMWTG